MKLTWEDVEVLRKASCYDTAKIAEDILRARERLPWYKRLLARLGDVYFGR